MLSDRKTNRNRHERNVQKKRKQKQPLWNNVDGTEYVTLIASNENVTWSETNDGPSVAAGTGGSIRACCRQLVGVQSYKHTSVKFCFPLSHFAFLSAWGRNMFCIASPQIGAVNILIRRIFKARFMVMGCNDTTNSHHNKDGDTVFKKRFEQCLLIINLTCTECIIHIQLVFLTF